MKAKFVNDFINEGLLSNYFDATGDKSEDRDLTHLNKKELKEEFIRFLKTQDNYDKKNNINPYKEYIRTISYLNTSTAKKYLGKEKMVINVKGDTIPLLIPDNGNIETIMDHYPPTNWFTDGPLLTDLLNIHIPNFSKKHNLLDPEYWQKKRDKWDVMHDERYRESDDKYRYLSYLYNGIQDKLDKDIKDLFKIVEPEIKFEDIWTSNYAYFPDIVYETILLDPNIKELTEEDLYKRVFAPFVLEVIELVEILKEQDLDKKEWAENSVNNIMEYFEIPQKTLLDWAKEYSKNTIFSSVSGLR